MGKLPMSKVPYLKFVRQQEIVQQAPLTLNIIIQSPPFEIEKKTKHYLVL